MIASSTIVGGLSWWQAWICVWLGYAIAAAFVCITARIGAVYHISFPVVVRSSFGTWGALWCVFNRAAMACVWYGVQSWIGGECVTLMIRAIWPSYINLESHKLSGTNVMAFTSFFLFSLGSLPAIWFPVHKIRHLFTVKAYFVPVAGIAFFAWAISRANGIGPIIHESNTIHGSALAWAMVKGIMSAIANFATLIVNSNDFSRFAKRPESALWSQLFTIPIGFAVTSFIGIFVSSASKVIYGTATWDPTQLLSQFLNGATHAERFGVFVIAAAFTLAQLGTNIAANSVSAGTDMTALMPKYINIRRGGYVCAAVGLAMCPWNLLSSSNNFTTYLSAYSVFLSSIAGVIVSDYYFVRKGYLQIRDLYSARPGSPYYYTYGFSIRGYTAYLAGILINIVGFVGAIGKTVPVGATYIYNLNFFCGFIVASSVYYLICRIWPVPAVSDHWYEVTDAADRTNSVAYVEGGVIDVEEGIERDPKAVEETSVVEGTEKKSLKSRFGL